MRVQLCAELLEPLLQACDDPRYAGYELVVTGHSLGGCAAEVVALKLRDIGREKSLEMLTKTRCLAFAGGPAATANLQQSAESHELTICVVYGDDVVPRLGTTSVCTLLDELCEHGIASMIQRKVGGAGDELQMEPEPESAGAETNTRPTQLALGGRVIWIDPDFSHDSLSAADSRSSTTVRALVLIVVNRVSFTRRRACDASLATAKRWDSPLCSHVVGFLQALPHMRWAEWGDLTKITASTKMIEHHLAPRYLGALEFWLGAALGLANPAEAMSELTRGLYEKQ